MNNIASHLCDAQDFIQERAVKNFSSVDAEFGRRIKEILDTKARPVDCSKGGCNVDTLVSQFQ